MTTIPNAQGTVRRPRPRGCAASGNITRSLLGYLVLAGPFYVAVSLAQALTRPGFSLTRDEWSLLALGPMGWIQMVNLILTGGMTVAGAIGVRRAVGRSAPGGVWAPRLLAGYERHRALANPANDSAVIRTLDLLIPDVDADWRQGEVLLQERIADAVDVERSASAVAALERMLVDRSG